MPVGHWPASPESQNILSWKRLWSPARTRAAHARLEPGAVPGRRRNRPVRAQGTAQPLPPGPCGTQPAPRFQLSRGLREGPRGGTGGLRFSPARARGRLAPASPDRAGRPLEPAPCPREEDGSRGPGQRDACTTSAFSFSAAAAAQGHKPCGRPQQGPGYGRTAAMPGLRLG